MLNRTDAAWQSRSYERQRVEPWNSASVFDVQGKDELASSLPPEVSRAAIREGAGEEDPLRVEDIVDVELHTPRGVAETAEAVAAHQTGEDVLF